MLARKPTNLRLPPTSSPAEPPPLPLPHPQNPYSLPLPHHPQSPRVGAASPPMASQPWGPLPLLPLLPPSSSLLLNMPQQRTMGEGNQPPPSDPNPPTQPQPPSTDSDPDSDPDPDPDPDPNPDPNPNQASHRLRRPPTRRAARRKVPAACGLTLAPSLTLTLTLALALTPSPTLTPCGSSSTRPRSSATAQAR